MVNLVLTTHNTNSHQKYHDKENYLAIMFYFCLSLLMTLYCINMIGLSAQHQITPPLVQQLKINLLARQKTTHVTPQHNVVHQPHSTKKFISNPVAKTSLHPKEKPVTSSTQTISKTPANITQKADNGETSSNTIHKANYKLQTPPHYPPTALDLGWEGTVTLHVALLDNGHINHVKIFESSGYGLLDKAALRAVKKWEFYPTIINGQATQSVVAVPVHFIINS